MCLQIDKILVHKQAYTHVFNVRFERPEDEATYFLPVLLILVLCRTVYLVGPTGP